MLLTRMGEVSEILDPPDYTRVPGVKDWVVGIANVRGSLLPLMDLKGFVTFHGGLGTPEGQDYSAAQGKYLILHGSSDTAITLEQFAALGEQLEKNKLPHELISYGGAPHAFTVFGSDRYREDADKKSWERFTSFLAEVF